jgi:hypothetical protein
MTQMTARMRFLGDIREIAVWLYYSAGSVLFDKVDMQFGIKTFANASGTKETDLPL